MIKLEVNQLQELTRCIGEMQMRGRTLTHSKLGEAMKVAYDAVSSDQSNGYYSTQTIQNTDGKPPRCTIKIALNVNSSGANTDPVSIALIASVIEKSTGVNFRHSWVDGDDSSKTIAVRIKVGKDSGVVYGNNAEPLPNFTPVTYDTCINKITGIDTIITDHKIGIEHAPIGVPLKAPTVDLLNLVGDDIRNLIKSGKILHKDKVKKWRKVNDNTYTSAIKYKDSTVVQVTVYLKGSTDELSDYVEILRTSKRATNPATFDINRITYLNNTPQSIAGTPAVKNGSSVPDSVSTQASNTPQPGTASATNTEFTITPVDSYNGTLTEAKNVPGIIQRVLQTESGSDIDKLVSKVLEALNISPGGVQTDVVQKTNQVYNDLKKDVEEVFGNDGSKLNDTVDQHMIGIRCLVDTESITDTAKRLERYKELIKDNNVVKIIESNSVPKLQTNKSAIGDVKLSDAYDSSKEYACMRFSVSLPSESIIKNPPYLGVGVVVDVHPALQKKSQATSIVRAGRPIKYFFFGTNQYQLPEKGVVYTSYQESNLNITKLQDVLQETFPLDKVNRNSVLKHFIEYYTKCLDFNEFIVKDAKIEVNLKKHTSDASVRTKESVWELKEDAAHGFIAALIAAVKLMNES